ncbi:MAG: Occludin/ELL family protein [Cyanobium sp.]
MTRSLPAAHAAASETPHHRRAARWVLLGAGLISALMPPAVSAGPVVCTTTLEAPDAYGQPVAVSRCGPVQTVPELMTRRFFTYTAPFEQGVNLTHQISDLFGISLGGIEGNRLMGFGFPDQTIISDGLALQNTTAVLLDAQSNPLPLRTADLTSCFAGSLAGSACGSRLR